MSAAGVETIEGLLDHLKRWPPSERIRLARLILETLDAPSGAELPRAGSLKGLAGLLKTEGPAPTDEECRAILEEELIKKHLR